MLRGRGCCGDTASSPFQVLLSQVHRLRALDLLGRFLDLGPWAVSLVRASCVRRGGHETPRHCLTNQGTLAMRPRMTVGVAVKPARLPWTSLFAPSLSHCWGALSHPLLGFTFAGQKVSFRDTLGRGSPLPGQEAGSLWAESPATRGVCSPGRSLRSLTRRPFTVVLGTTLKHFSIILFTGEWKQPFKTLTKIESKVIHFFNT